MKLQLKALAAVSLAIGASGTYAEACSLLASAPAEVASGLQYTEGPAWNKSGYWVFSDIPANTVYRFNGKGKPTPFKHPSGYANGNAFDKQGNLWSAQHDRRLTRTDPKGKVVVVVDKHDGKPVNSPNDLAIAADGAVWFSDPNYGITGYGPQKAPEEQPVRGIYRVSDGNALLMTGDLKQPNGLAFSPNGKYLYAGDTSDGAVYRFSVGTGGELSDKAKFAALEPKSGQEPMVDGVKVDAKGNVWVAGPKAIGVFDKDGKTLCRIEIDAPHVANLAFGGKGNRQVLVTASDRLFLLQLK